MNQLDLIRRAWQITWRYRVLWIFGILLALTGGAGGGGGGNSGLRGNNSALRNLNPLPGLGRVDWNAVAGIVVLCCCLLLVFAIAALVVHYVSRAALYRLVDDLEGRGSAPSWRAGFRLGWSNRTFRMFLLDLLVGIPAVVAALALIAVAAAPVLLLAGLGGGARVTGIILTVVLGLLVILLLIAMVVALKVLGEFWSRQIVLRDLSIGQALTSGFELVRANLRHVGLFWLLMFAIGLVFTIFTVPVALALLGFGIALGGGLGYALYAATHSVAVAVIAGLPIFLAVLLVPLSIIEGIYRTWQSSAWTLAYRSLAAPAPAAA